MKNSSLLKLENSSLILDNPGSVSILLGKGFWKIECWGASGGDSFQTLIDRSFPGGRGGYSVGVLFLDVETIVFLTSGGRGESNATGYRQHISGGYNGGGSGYVGSLSYPVGSGGGSSDVRIGGDGIEDRIIVAGGGGGAGASNSDSVNGQFGGHGGGVEGINGGDQNSAYGTRGGRGGSQLSGGLFGIGTSDQHGGNGSILQGGDGSINRNTYSSAGGGGGGYYGGGGSSSAGGGGGSGYIGGVASFYGIISMTSPGNTIFPSLYGGTEHGHVGDGIVKISLIRSAVFFSHCIEPLFYTIIPIFILVLLS